jgi:chorismate lyase / 3-hydroxybenzoate synthase
MPSGQVRGAGADLPVTSLPVDVCYLTPAQLRDPQCIDPGRVLGAIFYGSDPLPVARFPALRVVMHQCGEPSLVEVWTSASPVTCGRSGLIVHSANEEILFGAIDIEVSPDEPQFEDLVNDAYRQIFDLMESQGYPHLIRVWNYFPQINHESVGLENYQRFCRGRAVAFQARYGEFLYRLPSASAVGSHGGGVCIYFIASRSIGHHRENPRQVSAYHYPPQYGPRSPSFARATLKRWGDEGLLFISGTASIVGHESRHVGDIGAQVDETLRNIEALIGTTAAEEGVPFSGLRDLSHLKVYLREAVFLPEVQSRLNAAFGADPQSIYLEGDICRSDLLVEIEGVARFRSA